jgi:hypothetical protein
MVTMASDAATATARAIRRPDGIDSSSKSYCRPPQYGSCGRRLCPHLRALITIRQLLGEGPGSRSFSAAALARIENGG